MPELRRFVVSDGRRVAMAPTLRDAMAALAISGGEGEPNLTEFESGDPATGAVIPWPREALDLLNTAEEKLRDGDWTGFGEALDQLRTLLQNRSSGGLEG